MGGNRHDFNGRFSTLYLRRRYSLENLMKFLIQLLEGPLAVAAAFGVLYLIYGVLVVTFFNDSKRADDIKKELTFLK